LRNSRSLGNLFNDVQSGFAVRFQMKRELAPVIAMALFAGIAVSQSTPNQSGGSASTEASVANRLPAGSILQVELVKPLDVRKNRAGDEVVARVTHDAKSNESVVVPKGSRLIGRVMEAKPRAKDQTNSQLRLAFDRLILKDGTEIPARMAIQAIGRPRTAPTGEDELASGTTNVAPGGLLGGIGSTTTGAASDIRPALRATGLNATSQGVVGLQGLTVSTQASASPQVFVVSSTTTNVHLDSGTEMILRVNP
jgi:hypothetical protein